MKYYNPKRVPTPWTRHVDSFLAKAALSRIDVKHVTLLSPCQWQVKLYNGDTKVVDLAYTRVEEGTTVQDFLDRVFGPEPQSRLNDVARRLKEKVMTTRMQEVFGMADRQHGAREGL